MKVHRHMVEFRNTDNLVANPTWNIIVQKTGYIAEAGKCLVMAAVIEGRSVIIVLLDSFGKYTRVADAKRIKTWMEAGGHRQLSGVDALTGAPRSALTPKHSGHRLM